MVLYSVSKSYVNNKVVYQVLPYSLWGTIKVEFKYGKGLFSFIPFLRTCRLTKKSAIKLQKKLSVDRGKNEK